MIASIFMVLEISIALNAFFFVLTFILKKNVFTDMTYALTFLVTTIIIMIINSSSKVSQYLVLSLVILWTLRLGTFLFIRIYKTTVDHRFNKIQIIIDDYIKWYNNKRKRRLQWKTPTKVHAYTI